METDTLNLLADCELVTVTLGREEVQVAHNYDFYRAEDDEGNVWERIELRGFLLDGAEMSDAAMEARFGYGWKADAEEQVLEQLQAEREAVTGKRDE